MAVYLLKATVYLYLLPAIVEISTGYYLLQKDFCSRNVYFLPATVNLLLANIYNNLPAATVYLLPATIYNLLLLLLSAGYYLLQNDYCNRNMHLLPAGYYHASLLQDVFLLLASNSSTTYC